MPSRFICRMHAPLSERNSNPKIFDMKLLNFVQSIASGNSVQSAHESMPFSLQHARIRHHDAFSLPAQPGHLSLRYAPHAPQYKPQKATRDLFAVISRIHNPFDECENGQRIAVVSLFGRIQTITLEKIADDFPRLIRTGLFDDYLHGSGHGIKTPEQSGPEQALQFLTFCIIGDTGGFQRPFYQNKLGQMGRLMHHNRFSLQIFGPSVA